MRSGRESGTPVPPPSGAIRSVGCPGPAQSVKPDRTATRVNSGVMREAIVVPRIQHRPPMAVSTAPYTAAATEGRRAPAASAATATAPTIHPSLVGRTR